MENSTGPDTPENWSKASQGYAKHVAPLMMESFAAEFVEHLQLEPSMNVLEVAAGSGALTSTLAKHAKSLLASDFSPGMLEILQERMKAEGADNVECRVLDGQALDLPDSHFDRAACCFGLMLFPERDKGFSELRRVVRPGGRVMVSGWAGPDKFEGFALFLAGLKRAFPDLPPPPKPPPVFSLADLENFKAEMEQAGFIDVETQYVSRDLELPSFDALWEMMTSGAPPVQMILDRIGADGAQLLKTKLAEVVTERFGDGPVRVTNVATLGCGVVP